MLASMKLYAITFIAMLIVDYLWIGLIAQKFYVEQFGPTFGRIENGKFDIVMWAGIGAYLLMTAAVVFFVLPRLAVDDPWWMALFWGALMGLVMYGVYDMTNHATLRHWPILLMAVDMAWGMTVIAFSTLFAKFVRDNWI